MKNLVLTSIATMGLALGAFAQGAISMNNLNSAGGLQVDGNWFTGTFGMQLFELNGTTVPSGINNAATPMAAYTALSGSGATSQKIWTAQANTIAGVITLGTVNMPGVTPAGGNAVLGLAAWTGNYATWADAVNAGAKGGVVAFVNATGDYTKTPAPDSPALLDGWTQNLNMTLLSNPVPVPEPTSFALAGLGAAAMLIFRRRK